MKSVKDIVEILTDIVAFETVSGTQNLDLIDYAENLLNAHGATCRRVPSDDGTRTNLIASIGPMVKGGVVLSGHTDVVPVEGQDWASDPFRLTERDGKFFGRGVCDMKGFLAVALAALPKIATADLKRPMHFAFSYDEELGCLGAPRMIAEIARVIPTPVAAIVGEPTEMKVINCHKGCLDFTTEITGRSVHSSLSPRGVSAISTAAKLIVWLDTRQAEGIKGANPTNPMYPPFTTYHCGLIQGGSASNIVAKSCRFTTDIRVIDTEDAHDHLDAYRDFISAEVLPGMRAVAPEADIEVRVDADLPPFRRQPDNPAEGIARSITGDNELRANSATTEAGLFQNSGFATIVCGPGSLYQAHQPDEFVSKDQLRAAIQFIERIIEMLEQTEQN